MFLSTTKVTLQPARPTPALVNSLEYIANKLFICGFLFNKLSDLPLGFVSPLLSSIAICSIAIAYSIQIYTTSYYHSPIPKKSVLDYRDICQLMACIGMIASWLCILAPNLWLACLWVFCINNLLWIYNESTRPDSLSLFPSMPVNRQKYNEYVIWISTATLCSTVASTLMLLIPNANNCLYLIGKILNWSASILGIHALYASDIPEPTI